MKRRKRDDAKAVNVRHETDSLGGIDDSFPSAMYIAAAVNVKGLLLPLVTALRDAIHEKAQASRDIVQISRTHMQGRDSAHFGTGMVRGATWGC